MGAAVEAPAVRGAANSAPETRQRASFAALSHPEFRRYFAASTVSHIGDNVEHVISYWVMWQTFQSPLLAGFAIISHWTPFLLFSVYFGHLAQRFDQRRLIQASQLILVFTSLSWGLLFLTGTLQVWHAVVLLILHGMAGALGAPSAQMLIYDVVGREHLPSAVRLIATSRQVTLIFGPGVGGLLMAALGPARGAMANVLLYVPLITWLAVAPRFNRARQEAGSSRTFDPRDTIGVLREAARNRTILAMIVLVGVNALLVGSATQPLMPAFAQALGTDSAGVAYTALLASNAAGAFLGGLLLESTGWVPTRPLAAIVSMALWSVAMIGFAAAPNYVSALVLLFFAGIFLITASSTAQTLVQLEAPEASRGRIIGLFSTSQMGMRIGSAFSVGLLGSYIGIHWSLGLSSALILAVTLGLLAYSGWRPRGGASDTRTSSATARA